MSGGLVGRHSECDQLATALQQAVRGQGRIGTIRGPAGVGKTQLVHEALAIGAKDGFQVMYGAAAELERRRPFGVMADCLGVRVDAESIARSEIAGLLVGAAGGVGSIPAEAATAEFRIVEAMLALVEELCAHTPMAIAVDDLQWADPSSLFLLHRLASSVPDLPLLVLCAWRPVPRHRELDRLAETLSLAGAIDLPLGPLAERDVVELLRISTGAEPGVNLRRLASGTGGNPLFLTELVSALRREGALDYDALGRVEAASASLPPSLPLAILHRLSYLSDEALEVLRIAAVLGSRVEVSEVCMLLERSATSLLSAFGELISAGILDEDKMRLAFHHDLIREALYADVPPAVRGALHRDVARVLAAAGARPERVGEHAARGAALGDRSAVESLRRAAADAGPRSPVVALDWLDQALTLAGTNDPQRDELLAERAIVLLWSGRVVEAEKACRQLLACTPDPSLAWRVELCLAQALFARGRGAEAVRVAEGAAGRPELPDTEQAQVRAWVSLGHMAIGDVGAAQEAAETALASSAADELAIAVALTTRATTLGFSGHFRESVEVQNRAITVADEGAGRIAHRFPLNFFQAMFLVEVDDLDGARLALDRGRRASEELGARWNLPLYAWASAWVRFVAGAWDDAWAECEASVSLARELGTRHGVLLAHCLQGIIGLHRGELERAERAVAAAEAEFAATGPQHGLENVMVWARALLAEAHGDVATAVQVLGQAWEELSAAGVAGYRVDLGPDLVRLALANGDLGRAEAVTAEVEQVAHLNPGLGRTDGAALHCRGLVAASPELLAKGFAVLEGCARPFEAARVAEDAAGALARAGDRDQARRHCEAALRRYEGLEAWRSVARTEAAMRAYGLRRGSRARRARPVTGWESLTATERSVAELAARGLTNPQIAQRLFVSRHTVHTHLSHVLAKLQLSSRVELAGAAAVRRVQKLGQDPEQVQPAGERDGHPPVDVHAP